MPRNHRVHKDLAEDLRNAEETLADALDDTSCLSYQDIAALRKDVEDAKKALQESTK